MKNNIIYINGGSIKLLEKALRKWMDLNHTAIKPDYKFEILTLNSEEYIIDTDDRLNNELFFSLTDYIAYPEKKDYNIYIHAYATIQEIGPFPKNYAGQPIMLFIDKDKEAENIYGVLTDNKIFKIDFGAAPVPAENSKKSFRQQEVIPDEFTKKTIRLKRAFQKTKKKTTESNKLKKRFNILFILLIVLFLGSMFLLNFEENFYIYTMMVYFGFMAWLLWDYKMLRSVKMFLKCILTALAAFAYGLLILIVSNEMHVLKDVFAGCITLPLSFLLIQKPLRRIFIYYIEEEPIVDEDAGFINGVYTTTLVIATMFLCYLFSKLVMLFI